MTHEKSAPQRFNPKALTTAITAICAGVPVVYAQDAEQDSENVLLLEEVLVTATKRGVRNLQDVPMSITAFTGADIELQGFKRLDDYAGQIPSLSFGRREPGGSNVIIRGCAVSAVAFSDNPTTSVYLDEQSISQQGFNPDPRLVDIERLEALAGPQGTLFGEASQCGVLRIITNKPDASEFSSWVDLTGTSVSDGDNGYDASVMMNLPLVKDKLALRLVGFTAEDAGWVDNIYGISPGGTFDNTPYADNNVNTSNTDGARAALRWTPNDKWVIDAQAIFQDTSTDGFGDSDLDEESFAGSGLGEWEQLRFNRESWSDEWYQFALTAEGDLGFADLTVTAGISHRETRYETDSTAYWHTIQVYADGLREGADPPNTPYYAFYDWGGDPHALSIDSQEWDRTSFEARLSSKSDSDSRWSWIGGVFYNKNESGPQFFTADITGQSANCIAEYAYHYGCSGHFTYLSYLAYYYFGTFAPLSDNAWHGIYETNLKQTAVFGEVTFEATENLAITLGGRWYDIETDRITRNGALVNPFDTIVMNCTDQRVGRDDEGVILPDAVPLVGFDVCYADEFAESTEDGFVPKVNFTYRIDDDKMAFFTYSEGFRSGGVNAAKRGSLFGVGGPFHTFDSDTLKNWEIGTKTTWADGRFQFNITFYHMVWDEIQIEAVDPEANFYQLGILNFPEAEIDGFEADFSWVPAENWVVSGTLGYNDAALSETVTLFPDSSDPKESVSGTRLPIVPEWKGSLLAEYKFNRELWGAEPYFVGVYQYQGDSVNSLDGIQSILADNAVRTHPSYSTVNLRLGLNSANWTTSFFIDNVFDEYGLNLYNDRWVKTRLTTNRPRTFGINFRYNWN
jgi:outer membrane receptor protein involved in Fe transport